MDSNNQNRERKNEQFLKKLLLPRAKFHKALTPEIRDYFTVSIAKGISDINEIRAEVNKVFTQIFQELEISRSRRPYIRILVNELVDNNSDWLSNKIEAFEGIVYLFRNNFDQPNRKEAFLEIIEAGLQSGLDKPLIIAAFETAKNNFVGNITSSKTYNKKNIKALMTTQAEKAEELDASWAEVSTDLLSPRHSIAV